MKNKILRANAAYARQVENLLGESEGHDDAALNRRPADGGWSAIQTMHHLILSEELSLAYLRKKLSAQAATLPKLSLGARTRSFLLWASLSSPLKFKAPKWISTESLPEHATLAETRARWQRIRAEWADYLEQVPPEYMDRLVYRHPRAGLLGWTHLFGFFRTHLSRHRGQMLRALRR